MKQSHILIVTLLFTMTLFGASCQSTASDGGVFKSEDQGETWKQKVFVGQQKKKTISISGLNIEKLFFDPHDSSIIYLASKTDGLYKTETAGEQWKKLDVGVGLIRDVSVDSQYTNNVYIAKGTNILKSTDSGESWESIYTDIQNANVTQVLVDWFNQQRIFATTSIGSVLFSEDEGVTWAVIYQVDEPITDLLMDATDSRVVYALELDQSIHKTVDNGLSWNSLFDSEFKEEFKGYGRVKSMFMDPNNSQVLFITTPQGILKTYDGGVSWEYFETLIERGTQKNAQINNVVVTPGDSNSVLFSVGKLIHKTTDSGATWKTIETFPSTRKIIDFLIDPTNPDIIYAGTVFVEEKKKGFFR